MGGLVPSETKRRGGVLTPLQRHVAEIVASAAEQSDFALAGGAALIAKGEVARATRDLDFFSPNPSEVASTVPPVEQALRAAGIEVRRVVDYPTFVRLEVSDGTEITEVDFGTDARILPVERGPLGPTVAGEELAIDKVLAVLGRAQPRDFVDLTAVADRYGLKDLCAKATRKDAGFDPQMFREMLGRFTRLPRDEFDLSDQAYERLERTVARWRTVTNDLTRDDLDRRLEQLDRGDDLGLEM
jgi:hypothetical protein